jgi:hypothetical protein
LKEDTIEDLTNALETQKNINARWEWAYDQVKAAWNKEKRLKRKAQEDRRKAANPELIYEEALRKLEWNLRRGNEDRADYWSILAVTMEELYGVQRPKHLQENA